MATKKISALSTGTTANSSDKIPIERSGANFYITPAMILAGASSSIGLLARYHLSAAQTVASGATDIINFNTSDYDPSTTVTTGASWVFTAPATAWYDVRIVQTIIDPNGSNWTEADPLIFRLYKGGVNQGIIAYYDPPVNSAGANPWPFIHGSMAISLASTNTINLRLLNQSGAARKIDTSAAIEIFRMT